jgi:hypothetical protein
MPEELENQGLELPPAFVEYDVPGVGTVIAPEGEPGYRVRLPSGAVTAFPAHSGEPSEANAAADIAHALANPPPAPVPQSISRSEFVIAVRRVLGLVEGDIFALISQLPAGETQETARDLWENAREFRRDNSFLAALAQLNGNTSEEIDEVFRVGAALNLD